jgi:predicted RNA-binding protein associated with RNAse of E/G family
MRQGEIAVLRYVLQGGRIEMAWPCRVVEDRADLVALFIAAGSRYKAGPKRTAAEKRARASPALPPDEYVWRSDTLRLMFPGKAHSVLLFWATETDDAQFDRYFVNLEEPFRRTPLGFDTQDHTLDVIVNPDLSWKWRDEEELDNHVREGFFTPELASAVRAEGGRVIAEIEAGVHPCLGWNRWRPEPGWSIPGIPNGWDVLV